MQIATNFGSFDFSWRVSDEIEGSLQISGETSCSFNQFLKIVSADIFELAPEKYSKLSTHFVSSSQAAPLLMPKHLLKTSLQKAESLVKEALLDPANSSYLQYWSKSFEFLQSMKRAKIDKEALENLMHQRDAETSRTLRSFLPDVNGYASPIVYNVADSLTGRAKVASGPSILTAHQDVRKCIRSSFENGKVLSVDFRSVEPRIAMLAVGKQAPEDVYADLMEEFPGLDRQAAKLATLVALYGGRVNRLSEVVGDMGTARKSVSFVKSHFRVDELERMLSQQAESGLIRNILGRPLREATKNPRIRTNHFLQSSAAELAPLLFSELCQKFQSGIRPLFVIHDALIVDVSPEQEERFQLEAESITWQHNRMPVKVERLHPI